MLRMNALIGFGAGASGVGNDAFTKILLHMEGANAGTTFTDTNAGGSAHTWTPTSATTSTAQAKFGATSALFSSGIITTPDSADFTVGAGDFTIDFWVNRNSGSGVMGLCGQANSSATAGTTSVISGFSSTNHITFLVSSGGSFPVAITGASTITDAVWHHVALVRNGTDWRLYLDGVSDGSTTTSFTVNDSAQSFTIGREGDFGSAFSGYIDEFRLSVGVARWTSGFTPPTEAYGP